MISIRLPEHKRLAGILLLISIMTGLWLALAPAGLQGKLLAIGYGVCHQIASHTFSIQGKLLPLCSRCTGLFLGALATIAVLSSHARRGGFPKANLRWVLFAFLAFYAIDGINSTASIINGLHGLYTPSNLLRLISGAGMGIALGAMLMSIWNSVLWTDASEEPLLNSYRLLGICAASGAGMLLLVVLDLPLSYFPLAILSAVSVILLLTMVYTLLWTLALKKDNTLNRWQDAAWLFLLGGLTAMVQLGLMDGLRFALTGTWQGFML